MFGFIHKAEIENSGGYMDIIIEKEIRKFHEGFERKDSDITTLVIHGAGAVKSVKGLLSWMKSGGVMPDGSTREAQYRKGVALFHYTIDRDGQVYEIINPHNWVYHSSTGKVDRCTIGVELINGTPDNSGQYTAGQYLSLSMLVKYLNGVFNSQITRLVGHGQYKLQHAGAGKECPGKGFDWARFSYMIDADQRTVALLTEEIKIG